MMINATLRPGLLASFVEIAVISWKNIALGAVIFVVKRI